MEDERLHAGARREASRISAHFFGGVADEAGVAEVAGVAGVALAPPSPPPTPGTEGALGIDGSDGIPPPHATAATTAAAANKVAKVNLMTDVLLVVSRLVGAGRRPLYTRRRGVARPKCALSDRKLCPARRGPEA
jgi:hypothetical protein